MQVNTVDSSEEPWKPVMAQSCYSEHRAPTTHPYSVVFWSRRIQCEWPLPEVVQWADLIVANLQWFPHNHCTSSASWAVCRCHQLSDSDLGGLLAWLIFLCYQRIISQSIPLVIQTSRLLGCLQWELQLKITKLNMNVKKYIFFFPWGLKIGFAIFWFLNCWLFLGVEIWFFFF